MWWFKRKDGHSPMAMEPLGSLESALMQLVWKLGESSVRRLQDESHPQLAYTTIMTTLDRLYKKGLLTRRRVGKAYYYGARHNEKQYRENVARHLINLAVLNGKHNDNVVLSCFVDVVTDTDKQMLDHLDELVRAKRRALRQATAIPGRDGAR
jgi:predicted transcriptional regulator